MEKHPPKLYPKLQRLQPTIIRPEPPGSSPGVDAQRRRLQMPLHPKIESGHRRATEQVQFKARFVRFGAKRQSGTDLCQVPRGFVLLRG